ncbi:ABC transporter substrate-binding protein [Nocardioides caldifontis]|uniref:ABC transporter substrate-binding protein n=1 Tax=Nocardioides caldifontis TaxID=2588938 RepID=UPI0011DF7285|nr:hypothetical protein [Nocardioides caldifontis]
MVTELVVGSFTRSVLLATAARAGALEEVGLRVREVPVASSPAQFRSLLDGELDVALTSPDNVIAYRFSPGNPLGATADVAIVSAVDRGLGLALYGRPGLAAEGLRGATAGVDVPTSGFALAMYALAEALGVRREEYDVVALGSTPRRLEALREGRCDVTMLNAGNELVAEDAGCVRLASVAEHCAPYLGTVVAVAGTAHLEDARLLAASLRWTARQIVGGELAEMAADEAAKTLSLTPELAQRYVERLRDPDEGLVVDDEVDVEALGTLVGLRRRHLPEQVDGTDVLAGALEPGSGLVVTPTGLVVTPIRTRRDGKDG